MKVVNTMFQTLKEKNILAPAKKQLYWGILCWVMMELGFPLILMGLFDLESMSGYYYFQISCFCASFLLTLLCFLPFVKQSLQSCSIGEVFPDVFKSYGMYYVLSLIASFFIVLLDSLIPAQQVNPNQETITQLVTYAPIPMFLCIVLLVPITEELLVRGMIFAPLCRKSPFLAYLASSAIFSLLHVIDSIGALSWITTLENFLSYLPAGIVLGYMYQKKRSIVGSIMLHSFINFISFIMMMFLQG